MQVYREHIWLASQNRSFKPTFMASVPRWNLGATIKTGYASNYFAQVPLSFVYFISTLYAAIWGAELSLGGGFRRIYVVEPTSAFEEIQT